MLTNANGWKNIGVCSKNASSGKFPKTLDGDRGAGAVQICDGKNNVPSNANSAAPSTYLYDKTDIGITDLHKRRYPKHG